MMQEEMMPRIRDDWEADYHDPISDAEEARELEQEEREYREIMEDILLCHMMMEDEEFARRERAYWDRELQLDAQYYDDEDYLDEDYRYWQDHIER